MRSSRRAESASHRLVAMGSSPLEVRGDLFHHDYVIVTHCMHRTLVRPVADLARSFRVGKYLAARLNDSLAREWIRTDRIAAEVSSSRKLRTLSKVSVSRDDSCRGLLLLLLRCMERAEHRCARMTRANTSDSRERLISLRK